MEDTRRTISDALRALGKRNLVLAIHDPSFPQDPDDDLGHGSSCSPGAARFMAFAADLGFTGIQLGPQGMTSAVNPSPYDGTVLSRNPLIIALRPLVEQGLLSSSTLEGLRARRPFGAEWRVPYAVTHAAQQRALDEAYETFRAHPDGLKERVAAFRREHDDWLVPDALYHALCVEHARPWWRQWPDPLDQRLFAPLPGEEAACEARRQQVMERHAEIIDRYAFTQMLAHEQHTQARERAHALGLKLFGDLQVGLSTQDVWARRGLLLSHHVMGAPPSRTNPQGQPWNYAVLDPLQFHDEYGAPGPALRFMQRRMGKMLSDYDGVRIDHPHGICCPWVYKVDAEDPLRAVQHGARLFSSPDLPDHPELARHAIARPDQLDRSQARHADGWVRELDEKQVDRYAILLDAVLEMAHRNGGREILCEVLSTLPYPLARVMARHGLGRFRVTQKANPANPNDVYRAENAKPDDWVMIGNHDTRPIWLLLEQWQREERFAAQRAWLASRLRIDEDVMDRDPGMMAQAMLAELFLSPAQHVMVFVADLLGFRETYNRPGTVSDDNWTLRVAPEHLERYAKNRAGNTALNIPRALAMALRARDATAHAVLIARLEELASR